MPASPPIAPNTTAVTVKPPAPHNEGSHPPSVEPMTIPIMINRLSLTARR